MSVYVSDESCVFKYTRGQWGEFSNFHPGFPLIVAGQAWPTSEHLYQACKFLDAPIRETIRKAGSAKSAKQIARANQNIVRADWYNHSLFVMEWVLRCKLSLHPQMFGSVLLATGDRPIVESSQYDAFWGAKPTGVGLLIGDNNLGVLLMKVRDGIVNPNPALPGLSNQIRVSEEEFARLLDDLISAVRRYEREECNPEVGMGSSHILQEKIDDARAVALTAFRFPR